MNTQEGFPCRAYAILLRLTTLCQSWPAEPSKQEVRRAARALWAWTRYVWQEAERRLGRSLLIHSCSFIVDHLNAWPLAQNLLGVQAFNELLPCDAAWVATQHHVEEIGEATGSHDVDLISRKE